MEKYTTPEPILPAPGEEEAWKTHPVYIEYEVSTFGNVRRKSSQYMMTPTVNGRGYLTVHLRAGIEGKNGKYCRVHKLVADTFLGEAPGPEYECDHKDRNRQNNYVGNLRYTTHPENVANSRKRRKYIFMDRPAIVLLDKETHEPIREFQNLREIVEELGLSPASVRDNIHGFKPPFRIGYFMTKSEYLEKLKGKI